MQDPNEGTKGIGASGFSKYDAANAEVVKNGGNTAIQDHVVTEKPASSLYSGSDGSLGTDA